MFRCSQFAGSDSDEPDAKKRRLSANSKSGDESDKDDAEKKEEAEDKVKAEDKDSVTVKQEDSVTVKQEDCVTVKQEEVTKDDGEPAETVDAEDVDLKLVVKTEDVVDEEAKEKMRAECSKVIGFMATVDVDVMMNEMERVSSDSSGDSSGSEGEVNLFR